MSLPASVGHSRRRPTNLKNCKSKPPSPHVDHDMSRMARPSMDITSTVPPHITSPLPTTINNLKLKNLRFTKSKPPAPVDHDSSKVARSSVNNTSTPPPYVISSLPNIADLLEQAKVLFRPLLFQVGRDRLAWVTLNGAEPLMVVLPSANRRRLINPESDQLTWEWSLLPKYDFNTTP